MPVSKKQKEEMQQRVNLVSLLVGFGMAMAEAARRIGISPAQVRYAALKAQEQSILPSPLVSRSGDEVFFKMLDYYVAHCENSEITELLEWCFPEFVHFRTQVCERACGAVLTRIEESTLDGRILEPYRRLMFEVTGYEVFRPHADILQALDPNPFVGIGGKVSFWWELFVRVTLKECHGTVSSLEDLERQFRQYVLDRMTAEIEPILSFNADAFVAAVTHVLTTLTSREQDILRRCFELGGEPQQTYKNIGEDLGISGTVVSNAEDRALRKLRHPSRLKPILRTIVTPSRLRGQIRELEQIVEKQDTKILEQAKAIVIMRDGGLDPALRRYFDMPVDSLDLSERSRNCLLKYADPPIRYVGELVRHTEARLLEIKNLGPRSLKEIKEILAEMGMELGMDVGDWQPPSGR